MSPILKSVDSSIEKLLNEPSSYCGHLTKNVLNILFGKINYISKYLDATREYKCCKNIEKFIEKHSEIPEEKECVPEFEQLSKFGEDIIKYVDNETISKMFYTLLLSSFNIDLRTFIHPAFHEIIKQLSPIDARMLHDIKNKQKIEGFTIVKDNSDEPPLSLIQTDLIHEFGIEQCAFSISNIHRLGLIDMEVYLLSKDILKFVDISEGNLHLEDPEDLLIPKSYYPDEIEANGYSTYKCNIFVNSFGSNFLKVCVD